MDVQDRVVIVTGASRGIGLATSRLLGSLGAKIALVARSEGALKRAAAEIPGSRVVRAELRRRDEITSMVQAVQADFGKVEILVNVAGQGMFAPVESIDVDQFREIMDLNVYGALMTMQAVIPMMRAQGEG
jgi:NAD(P)-dependent dehydrogenase (short-subunit alcohol dehydrogenase family)